MFLVACYATTPHFFRPYVNQLVGWWVGPILLFYDFHFLTSLLLPQWSSDLKYDHCPLDSHVYDFVSTEKWHQPSKSSICKTIYSFKSFIDSWAGLSYRGALGLTATAGPPSRPPCYLPFNAPPLPPPSSPLIISRAFTREALSFLSLGTSS